MVTRGLTPFETLSRQPWSRIHRCSICHASSGTAVMLAISREVALRNAVATPRPCASGGSDGQTFELQVRQSAAADPGSGSARASRPRPRRSISRSPVPPRTTKAGSKASAAGPKMRPTSPVARSSTAIVGRAGQGRARPGRVPSPATVAPAARARQGVQGSGHQELAGLEVVRAGQPRA